MVGDPGGGGSVLMCVHAHIAVRGGCVVVVVVGGVHA